MESNRCPGKKVPFGEEVSSRSGLAEFLMTSAPSDLESKARSLLESRWESVFRGDSDGDSERIPREVSDAIDRSVNSTTKTYRYVLPTQLLAKCADPSLDCRSIQKGADLPSAFDARSLCSSVVVDFDRRNNNVLGGSSDPYVSKPLRIPSISPDHAKHQKNKGGFADLILVLDYAQSNPKLASSLLDSVLLRVRSRLQEVAVEYPVPLRASLDGTLSAIDLMLDQRSGGSVLQAIGAALFAVCGTRFHTHNQVVSRHVNSADEATGSAADIECVDDNGNLILAVEIKDRPVTLGHLVEKLTVIRSQSIKEFLLVGRGIPEGSEADALGEIVRREFASGHNIYVITVTECVRSVLILLGESGRRDVLMAISGEMEKQNVEIRFRRRWRDILQAM